MSTILFDNAILLDPQTARDECARLGIVVDTWVGKANSFVLPRGKNYGRGWLLMLAKSIQEMQVNGTIDDLHTLTFVSDYEPPIVLNNIVLIKASKIIPSTLADAAAVYVVEVADARYLAQNRYYAVPTNVQYNVREPDSNNTYYYETMVAGFPYTWQQIADDMWGRIGVPELGTSPTLPTLDGTPENFKFIGVSAWEAYNDFLARAGCVFLLRPDTGASVVKLGTPDTILTFAQQTWDGLKIDDREYIESYVARVPRKVTVYFHNYAKHYGAEPTTASINESGVIQWSTAPVYSITMTDAQTSVIPADSQPRYNVGLSSYSNAVKALYDDLAAVVDFDGAVLNAAALNTRAQERVDDYYRRVFLSDAHAFQVYANFLSGFASGGEAGIHGFYPWSVLSAVIWCSYGHLDPISGGNQSGDRTIIIHRPDMVEDLFEPLGALEGMGDDILNLRPPDIARHTNPVYPRLPQTIKIKDTTAGFGADTDTSLRDVIVERYNPDTAAFVDDEPAWAVPISRDRRLARLTGIINNRPIYLYGSQGVDVKCETIAGAFQSVVTDVSVLDFYPCCAWTITDLTMGVVRIERILDVLAAGGTAISHVSKITYTPGCAWTVAADGDCGVTVKRLLSVQATGGAANNDIAKITLDPACAWNVVGDGSCGVTVKRKLTFNTPGGSPSDDVANVSFSPACTWDISGDGNCGVIVKRLLSVQTIADIASITFAPTCAWTVTPSGLCGVTVKRNLTVQTDTISGTCSGQSVSDVAVIDFSPCCAWNISSPQACVSLVERRLQFYTDSFASQLNIATVKFEPNCCWTLTDNGICGVVVKRNLTVQTDYISGVCAGQQVNDVAVLDFTPCCAWNISSPQPCVSLVERRLQFYTDSFASQLNIATVNFQPDCCWTLTNNGLCGVVVKRNFTVTGGSVPCAVVTVNDVAGIEFTIADFIVNDKGSCNTGVRTRGYTGTRYICEADGLIHTYVYIAGLLKTVDGVGNIC